jgi:NADH dehydrogenase [ubiquinone] 1 alpha subcomplex assembly factor 7
MTPAPALRRETPLAEALIARIRRDGPIGVDRYMEVCLNDPVHGYYRRRRAIGRDGDFVTAPEISQVFGELIGLWCAVVWQQMGEPSTLRLVELGPGRGTLMADALRAARALPAFHDALQVHLVETSSELAVEQRAALQGERAPIEWDSDLDAQRHHGPLIVIANEFLDTLPVAQWTFHAGRWHSRCVGLDAAGRLAFVDGAAEERFYLPPKTPAPMREGAVLETRAQAFAAWAQKLGALGGQLAALFIDYGHVGPALGDTLQATRAHRYDDPLAAPGESDLTAQVDFAAFAQAVTAHGLACDGPVSQAEFLGQLGIAERASRLMSANPAKAAAIETAIARLMAPVGMGTRFCAIGVRSQALSPLPGLTRLDSDGPAP